MKKVIAAVDFSEPSINAARYALQLVQDLPGASLTLYYVYNPVTAGSDGTPLTINNNDRKTIALTALQNIQGSLQIDAHTPVELVVESGDLVKNLEKYVKHNNTDLVVMGITGSTKLEQVFIGSTTLSVIGRDICPVLIVPGAAVYKKIGAVVLTSDLQDVENSTPIIPLKQVLSVLKPTLYIVNVTDKHITAEDNQSEEKEKLQQLLNEYNPKTYFIHEEEFDKGVADFAAEYKIDIIITSPKKHSFLSKLFKSTHTQKLAFRSELPILAINSWE